MHHKYSNSLIHETSPYLLQHAHNPVNWYAWGDEALNKAKLENKVILVSIGYSACHWCHVMERESFEDEATAAIMNENFINIKIDREERPDIDHIYMDAVQAMTGSGGWPLNVFLTPDKLPFYGGTYFPPVRAFNRSSWKEVLQQVHLAWINRKDEIQAQAIYLTEHLAKTGNFFKAEEAESYSGNDCDKIFSTIMQSADREWGGFGRAPKFPQTFTIQYLLEHYHFTKNSMALEQAVLSIDKMIQGGIYDHLAGGLARYSTDQEWLVPHFEKMLYDNALLVITLCDAFQLTKNNIYEAAIRKTLEFVLNEMTDANGGFYSALDADSEGEEGKYYVWSKDEIVDLLQQDAELFCDLFDVSAEGNWEGKNILRLLLPVDEFAERNKIDAGILNNQIDKWIKALKSARHNRIRPGLDDKIILGWNALMAKAFSKASIVLRDERYKKVAVDSIHFLLNKFKAEDSTALRHTYKRGLARYPAFLDDYAYLIDACLNIYEATFDEQFLQVAHRYTEHVIEFFDDDEHQLFYFTSNEQKDVIVRKKELYDGATASPNSVMAVNLYKIGIMFDNTEWLNRSLKMLHSMSALVLKHPTSFAVWAAMVQQLVYQVNEITITGTEAKTLAMEFCSNHYIPNKIIGATNTINNNIPFFRNKRHAEVLNIYLCKNRVCLPPLKSEMELLSAISQS